MIALLRQHLLSNTDIVSLLDSNQGIYHIEKPSKLKDKTYIVIKDKLLSDKYIEEYQLTFRIISDDLEKVIEIEKVLRKYLNDVRGEKIIKNNDTYIRNIQTLNGGGTIRTPENDYLCVVYFIAKK